MGKFRKKPVVIEAEQFRHEDVKEGKWHEFNLYSNESGYYLIVSTLEGDHRANDRDWIITGVKGEKYPCKPDIFEMTYEKVE